MSVEKVILGSGVVSLWMRHARSLKDRRQVTQGLIQRLKNEGFSATELDMGDNFKRAMIAFCICSGKSEVVTDHLERAKRIFIGDFEIVHAKTEISEMETEFELPFIDE